MPGVEPRFAAPPVTAAWLAGKLDIVSVANNHFDDQGEAGRRETLALLRLNGLRAAEESQPAQLTRNGISIVVVARDFSRGWSRDDAEPLLSEIRRHRRQAVVLVSLHWGTTGSYLPTQEQRELAAAIAEAGASIVIGHGPHTLQGVERRGGAVIAYSLGNLAFVCPCTSERDALVLRVGLAANGDVGQVIAQPIRAGLFDAPTPTNDKDVATLIDSLSRDLGSKTRLVDGSVEILRP